MAHNLDILADGTAAMFSVGETPWHKLGRVVREAPTAAEAIEFAGLNWEVKIEPTQTMDGTRIYGVNVTRRSTDGAILGVVGDRYRALQNHEAFAFFDAFVEAGEASFETAGALDGGRKVWILAKINRDPLMVGTKDRIDKYVLLSNGHDGKTSTRAGFTATRVVCQNTLTLAHRSEASKLLRVRHSSQLHTRLADIRTTMNMIDQEFEMTGDMYRRMAASGINRGDLEKYAKILFGKDGGEGDNKAVTKIMDLAASGMGHDLDSANGTVFGAYQAVNEYLNHHQGRTLESRTDNLIYGQAGTMDQKALNLAYNYVTVGGF